MSRDIRSFLIKVKYPNDSKVKLVSSSEDDNPKTPKKKHSKAKQSKNPVQQPKKRQVISSDEDEEVANKSKNQKKPKVENKTETQQEKLVEVNVSDVFKKKPINRVNAPKIEKKIETKQAKDAKVNGKEKKPASKSEIIDLDDDNFDETLGQLDIENIEEKYMTVLKDDKSSDKAKDTKIHENGRKSKEEGKSLLNSESKNKELSGIDKWKKKTPEKNLSSSKSNDKTPEKSSCSPKSKEKKESSPNSKSKNKGPLNLDKLKKKNQTSEGNSSSSKPEEKTPEKNEKNDETKKRDKHEVDKKKKHHPSLEIEKISKPQKAKEKDEEEVDYNKVVEENIDKKKQLYQSYLNRGGARNPGSKKVPEGADNCFASTIFLVTGVLESLERHEIESIIKQYGGKIATTVTKKLNYMIVGDEPGPSKMLKARNLGVKQLSEDDFLNLLRDSPGKPSTDTDETSNKRKREPSVDKKGPETKKNKPESFATVNKSTSPPVKKDLKEDSPPTKTSKSPEKSKAATKESSPTKAEVKVKEEKEEKPEAGPSKAPTTSSSDASTKPKFDGDCMTALVEKYRPKSMKQIIGQNGPKSNVNKLHSWLKNWYNIHGKNKPKPKYNSKEPENYFKAALLSGPPGVGKTTTTYVVCADLGFEIIEFNASDTRNQKLLQAQISGILRNKTVTSCLKACDTKNSAPKHVLFMDEVDGMSGNEDRGGLSELLNLIKTSDIPIICACNDRQNMKMKSLVSQTFELRFNKPRVEQIRAAMMSICYKEGIKLKPDELTRIIESTDLDIRQVLNHLSMLSGRALNSEEKNKSNRETLKNLQLGPWEVVQKVFDFQEQSRMSFRDKSNLFFFDYSIAPLFVQENYLIVTPAGPRELIWEKVAASSESLAIGDVIDRTMRNEQNYGLLPVQAVFSSVIPGTMMKGKMHAPAQFPSWLGKNSTTNKSNRRLGEIAGHARVATRADKDAINLDYMKLLTDRIVRPLAVSGKEGINDAIELMKHYQLSREDLEGLLELSKWPSTRDLWQSVDTVTRTAFTKAYNKTVVSDNPVTKSKSGKKKDDGMLLDGEEMGSDDEDSDDDKIENDRLIKAKVPSSNKKPDKKPSTSAASTSRGRGRKPAAGKNAKK